MAQRLPYDSTLQMFIRTPQPVDLLHVRFLRWLAENGRLEHGVAGQPSGELADQISPPDAATMAAA